MMRLAFSIGFLSASACVAAGPAPDDAPEYSAADYFPDGGKADDPSTPTRPLPDAITTAAPDLHLVSLKNGIALYERDSQSLDAAGLGEFRKRAQDAVVFDAQLLRIAPTDPALDTPIRVIVLDTRAYDRATDAAGTYGVAFQQDGDTGDAVVLPANGLGDLAELDDTLAHELTHIVQGRIAEDTTTVPYYLVEGIAVESGSAFAQSRHGVVEGFVTSYLDASGNDAQVTFRRYGVTDKTRDIAQLGHDEALGGLFVEYLRVKIAGSSRHGFADAQHRILEAMRTGGSHAFATAFEAEFGLSLASARARFISWLDDEPADTRWTGTLYD